MFSFICFGLTWDLFRTIRDPYQSTRYRQKLIFISASLLTLTCFAIIFITHVLRIDHKNEFCGSTMMYFMLIPIMGILSVTFLIFMLISVIFACKGLVRKGLNKDVRHMILMRHILFLICVMCSSPLITIINF